MEEVHMARVKKYEKPKVVETKKSAKCSTQSKK